MTDLATLAEFKTYKNIPSNNTKEDATITQLISAASAFIKEYCGRTFLDNFDEEIEVYVSGSEDHTIYLDEYPIVSAVVEFSEDGGQTYTLGTEYADYYVGGDHITSGDGSALQNPTISHNAIKITYTGGYEEVPADLNIACLDLVEYYRSTEYNPKSSLGTNMVERSTADYYGTKLPGHIFRVLSNYREI
ncbi:MAG: phage gp6-like head-tail connector protein [Desulfobacteraceae bacterium]|nr:phage gp6-like head-tail connector protein [Desulfobacteraceae bacterium]